MIKVLFNDSCPICSKEINHYKSLENDIKWIDINDLEISMRLSGKSHRELIRRLHVIKDDPHADSILLDIFPQLLHHLLYLEQNHYFYD